MGRLTNVCCYKLIVIFFFLAFVSSGLHYLRTVSSILITIFNVLPFFPQSTLSFSSWTFFGNCLLQVSSQEGLTSGYLHVDSHFLEISLYLSESDSCVFLLKRKAKDPTGQFFVLICVLWLYMSILFFLIEFVIPPDVCIVL